MKQKALDFIKKNWKGLVLILAIALLIFMNVRQYQQAAKIVAENQRINIEYLESLKREKIYNQEITSYKDAIKQKDAEISKGKNNIAKTEADLKISQSEAKRLAGIITKRPSDKPIDTNFVKTCDSLAVITPILSDQVDTLKAQNKQLVGTLETKSKLQDSVISVKDKIILDKGLLLDKTVDSYNKATVQLQKTESKLNTEKKRKSFWKKLAIGLGLGVAGVFVAK